MAANFAKMVNQVKAQFAVMSTDGWSVLVAATIVSGYAASHVCFYGISGIDEAAYKASQKHQGYYG